MALDDHSANTTASETPSVHARCESPYLVYFASLNVMEQKSAFNKRQRMRSCTLSVPNADPFLISSMVQRSGPLAIIRSSQSQPPSSQLFSNGNPLASPSKQPNDSMGHPQHATINMGKHKSPNDDVTAEEDVQRMEIRTDAV